MALKINADKTEFTVLGKKNQPQWLQIREQKIEEQPQAKYLGVLIDNELNYKKEVKKLLSKMAQSIKRLYNLGLPSNKSYFQL